MISKQVMFLLLGTVLASTALATITKDKDQSHGHSKEYFHSLKSKYQDEHLYVHLISHTHDDVGWLKTVDQYYSGSNDGTQQAEVHLILDTTIQELINDPKKRFTYVEMKFFSMWWSYQTEDTKAAVRGLVAEGRLEFVNAGWSMHDEACTHYEDQLNNMMVGHDFLMREFQYKPRIGWHVDPFGHSNANPRLFAEMGFDAWFFARIDYEDKEKRLNETSMQWLWRPFFDHLGKSVQIFTGTMQDHYCWPSGFWYDERFNSDDPVVDQDDLQTFNADQKMAEMMDYVVHMKDHYQGNHLLIPMGCDFSFANAHLNFDSMDRLINYFNNRSSNVTLLYSTPGMYLDALIAQNLTWPTKYDDMFPYADSPDEYWTGYFTSRANSKKQIRDGQANMHASNKLYALQAIEQSSTDQDINDMLSAKAKMLDSMGLNQHHDAVSGTAKQYVANDYAFRLAKSMQQNNAVQTQVIDEIMRNNGGVTSDSWSWCASSNSTYLDCPIANNTQSTHIVAVHNPSLIDIPTLRMKVPHGNYNVFAWNITDKQMEPVEAVAICINKTIANGTIINDCEMHVKALVLANSYQYLVVQYNTTVDITVQPTSVLSISNAYETLTYTGNSTDGAVFQLSKYGQTYNIAFDIKYYDSNQGNDTYPDCSHDPSGAYLFRVMPNETESKVYSKLQSVQAYNGTFIQEIHLFFNDTDANTSAVVRVRAAQWAQVTAWDVTLYGIPYNGGVQGQEVTVNWKSMDINNNNTFYTDSNALEMQKRILNYRPTWDIVTNETIASNFYPINSAIAIIDTDKNLQMTIMNDRSQAGSVIQNGRIELMHQRRLYYDDSRGVDEALNETDAYGNGITVPATYHLQFIKKDTDTSVQRFVQAVVDEPLQYFFTFNFTQTTPSNATYPPIVWSDFTTMNLPVAFKYEMFPIKRNVIFVRFENIADNFDYPGQNQTNTTMYVKVKGFAQSIYAHVNPLTPNLNHINVVETTLTGNQNYNDMVAKKVQWMGVDDATIVEPPQPMDKPDFEIALQPQRIRSFYIEFIPALAEFTQ